ncbi:permease [Corynebacterium sp. HMSC034B08]|uniref:purine-cytosine permease family protein n=1 Tax=Corynebacterium sp. HMSC034B08 TaxID=1715135 RepID=UPI0008A98461|nr:cytosine permease [Corynebacterium sp. HMSC034B08]OHO28177.1 permease [Corynebacterium sp. HMSC034B08]
MTTKDEGTAFSNDNPLSPVPLEQRQKWITPAIIFGGLEFTIPVLMVGATLAASFSLGSVIWIVLLALLLFQWPGNAISGYIGAKTGLPSTVIAKNSFGVAQAKLIAAGTIFISSLGWWALQTAVAGNAFAAMLGIDPDTQWGMWALITAVAGLTFAIPSIIGYSSMKWTDYIAVPAGLLLIVAGIYFAVQNSSWEEIKAWNPEPIMTVVAALSLVIGVNASQWVISADYTRYAKPLWKDNVLIPWGIIGVGIPLFVVGAFMAVGIGEADIVAVMVELGFPFWGFLILWLATWTSQLVNNYSMGLALSNLMNVDSSRGRQWLTLVGTLIGIALALAGFLDYFTDFLYLTSLVYPAIAAIVTIDFFFIRKQQWEEIPGWNWVATVATLIGIGVGYYTQYANPIGIPALQSLFAAGIVYYIGMVLQSKTKPGKFSVLPAN